MLPTSTVRSSRGALLLAVSLLASGVASCSSDAAPEKKCGGIEHDGQCFKVCDPANCLVDNYCFVTDKAPEGFCGLPCATGADCALGYACTPGTATLEDGTTKDNYCKNLGMPSNGAPGTKCTGESQCDTGHGMACLGGICTWKCDGVDLCTEGYECRSNPTPPAGGSKGYCVAKGNDRGPGQYGTACPSGKDTVCDTANGFQCVGVVGKGYCSKKEGCSKDVDCPSGYWCSALRVLDADKKNVDFSQHPAVCVKRAFCAPCESDIDCSLQTGAVCVPDKNGEKFCSFPCQKNTNSCVIGAECKDVGSGLFACVPDLGVCHEATPQGCSPCRNDLDCGADAMCSGGKVGYKAGMSWCMTPCGPADEFGKSTCPLAPNGLEMICLDENEISLGGPWKKDDPEVPNYLYNHCTTPLTVDNLGMYDAIDPPRNQCGNYIREGEEECDDGNTNDSDGCGNDCMITAACTFKVKEPNGDVWATPPQEPVIEPAPKHVVGTDFDPRMDYVVSAAKCKAFKITGALETPADVDTIAIRLDHGLDAWLDTYTGGAGKCSADLVTEVRAWGNLEKTADLNMLDPAVKCEQLSKTIKNLDAEQPSLCEYGAPAELACGDCFKVGLCGQCDDDGGYGNCTRLLISTTTSYQADKVYKVGFDGKYKLIRIYSRDATKTVSDYTLIVARFTAQSNQGAPTTPPAFSCY